MHKIHILFFILKICVVLQHVSASSTSTYDRNLQPRYNILSMQWSPGYCFKDPKCIQSSIKPYWTIHGLWPPSVFCGGQEFRLIEIESLQDELNAHWPSVMSTRDHYPAFWKSEYDKHGSCYNEFVYLGTVWKYFSQVLSLSKRINIYDELERKGIYPSKSRTVSPRKIKAILSAAHGAPVMIVCKRRDGVAVLSEARFCFNSMFQPTECYRQKSQCPDEILYLPASK